MEQEAPSSKYLYEHRIRAAAQWIEQSRNAIFHASSAGGLTEQELDQKTNGPLYKGVDGLSQERWKFWETKFSELADREISEDVKTMAMRAVRQMAEIERFHVDDHGP